MTIITTTTITTVQQHQVKIEGNQQKKKHEKIVSLRSLFQRIINRLLVICVFLIG